MTWGESRQECSDPYEGRQEVCDALGEAPYDPQIDPADFVNPDANGDTEDMGEVLSITALPSTEAASCTGDCVLRRDWTPLEPDVEEQKYYSRGIGLILEVNPETGERLELVEFEFVAP